MRLTLSQFIRTRVESAKRRLASIHSASAFFIAEAFHRARPQRAEAQAPHNAADRAYVTDKHFEIAIAAGAFGAWDLDTRANVATITGETRMIYGFDPDAVVNRKAIEEIILPDDLDAAKRDFESALHSTNGGEYRSEYRIRRPSDGAVRWIAARGQTLFERSAPVRIVGVSRDVTNEKAAADALLERTRVSERLANVALAAPGVVGTFYIAPNGHVAYRYVSPKAKTVLGLDPAAICTDAKVFFKRLRREDLPEINEGLFRSQRELSLWVFAFLFDHPEKGPVWIEAQAAPVREADGLVVWHGYASDVTCRKRIELSLAETAERLQATVDAAPDTVFTMDVASRIQSMNRAGAAMFGYDEDELVGANVDILIETLTAGGPSADRPAITSVGERREIRGRRKNGDVFPAELTLAETRYDRTRLLVGFVKDLTQQRKFERQRQELHRNRLDAMGGMAAALAHEINQPLAANATYLKVARRMLEKAQDASEILEVLDKATAQTMRAGRIVSSLRDLMRRGESDKTRVSMHALVREALDSLPADETYANIAIRLDCRAFKDEIVADRTQLRQVLANLIRNAAEAMQSAIRRELVISTVNPEDNTIRVDVIDTGCGLPETSTDGCFDPFITTKAKGMGVGLSISRSIIEAHYGRIWAEPNMGGGAIFSFTLPLQSSGLSP